MTKRQQETMEAERARTEHAPPDLANSGGGHLPRHPTADPNRFVIPIDEVTSEYAEHVARGTEVPAEPRPASTVVLVREADHGIETLLLRRHARSGFAAGAWVFPGGSVDAVDLDPALPVLCDGPSPDDWAETLGLSDGRIAFAYVAAALREAFEETGILLAHGSGTGEPGRAGELAPEQLDAYRSAFLAGETSLREIAARESLRFAVNELLYIGHWVTPEPEPRRYDTRFFLAPVPRHSRCVPHEREIVEARWVTPAAGVESFASGHLKMLPPTVHTLRHIARFERLGDLRLALNHAPVARILPTMRRSAEGIVIEVPPD